MFRALMISLTFFFLGSLAESASARPGDHPQPREQKREAQGAAPRPLIELRGDLLSVRVRNSPRAEVLQEIERQTGISIDVRGPISGTLTEEFEGLPLEKGVRRLFRDANVLFLYAKGTREGAPAGKLLRVWLFPKEGSPLGDSEPPRPPSAAGVVGKQDELGSMVKNALEAEAAEEREKGLLALGGFKDPRIIEALSKALGDADENVRESAVDALGQLKDERAIEPLSRALLEDQSEDVRESAADALGALGHPRSLEALQRALQDPASAVRESAVESLGRIGGKAAIEALQTALQDDDADVKEAAQEALEELLRRRSSQ